MDLELCEGEARLAMGSLDVAARLKLLERKRTGPVVLSSQALKVLNESGVIALGELVLGSFLQTNDGNPQHG